MKENKPFTIQQIQEKIAHYCAYQDRCHWEVEQKFYEFNLIPEVKEQILLFLIQHDFLNEERFAKNFAQGKFNQKKWGRIKITQELKRRNISDYLIKIALKEIDDNDYINTLKVLIDNKSKFFSEINSYQTKQKMIRYLLQKGFEYDLILNALRS